MKRLTKSVRHASVAACSSAALLLLSPVHAEILAFGSNSQNAFDMRVTGTSLDPVTIGLGTPPPFNFPGTFEVNANTQRSAITTANANSSSVFPQFGGSASLIAGRDGNTGSILVSGNGSAGSATLNSRQDILLGFRIPSFGTLPGGTGDLTVQDGGLVQVTTDSYGITIGGSDAIGAVTVTGANSRLTVRDRINVGSFSGSSGSLTVSNGGLVESIGTADSSLFAGGSGTGSVLVTGLGSRLVTSGVVLGNGPGGNGGTVTVVGGGTVTIGVVGSGFGNGLSVGADSPSEILVADPGSTIQVVPITAGDFAGNEINIGGFGQGALIIGGEGTVDAAGANVNVSGGVSGTSTSAPGVLTVSDGGKLTADNVRVYANGTLNGNNTIIANVIAIGGTIAPEQSPGTLTIDGNYTQDTASQLIIEIAGNGAGEFDVLNVLGTATFATGSSIAVVFTDGFAPSADQVFDFLLAGNFGSDMSLVDISIVGLADGFEFDVGFTDAGTVNITALNDGISVVPVPAAVWLFGSALGLMCVMRRKISN